MPSSCVGLMVLSKHWDLTWDEAFSAQKWGMGISWRAASAPCHCTATETVLG